MRRTELPSDTVELARYLIGKVLVHGASPAFRRVGRIVETEAYPPGDAASHAFGGATQRNAAMFLRLGHAYVYFSYGMHWLFNVSSAGAGVGAAVLVRALEPLERLLGPSNGPAKLTRAMGFGSEVNGIDLCARAPLWLGEIDRPISGIACSARTGISKAVADPLRFYESCNVHVSRHLPGGRKALPR